MAMTPAPARLADRIGTSAPGRRLLRRFADVHDRGCGAADASDESLARYDQLLASEALACEVPADLLRAICWYSSGWRHYDPSGALLRTPRQQGTSWGCMQLNDHWHPDAFPGAMADPQASIRYAANLLHWIHEQVGDWDRATVAFLGHDGRAESAARKVLRYAHAAPWSARLGEPARTGGAAAREPGCAAIGEVDDLYAELGS